MKNSYSANMGDDMDAYLQIAEAINKDINKIFLDVLSGREEKYRTKDGLVRWGRVEVDIHKCVFKHLTDDQQPVQEDAIRYCECSYGKNYYQEQNYCGACGGQIRIT